MFQRRSQISLIFVEVTVSRYLPLACWHSRERYEPGQLRFSSSILEFAMISAEDLGAFVVRTYLSRSTARVAHQPWSQIDTPDFRMQNVLAIFTVVLLTAFHILQASAQ